MVIIVIINEHADINATLGIVQMFLPFGHSDNFTNDRLWTDKYWSWKDEKMKRWDDEKSHLSPNKIPATHISNSYWKVKRVNKKWVNELTNLKIKE